MKKIFRKLLIYLLLTAIVMPSSIFVSSLTASKAKAADVIVEGFSAGVVAPTGWSFTGVSGTYTTDKNYGAAAPSIQLDGSQGSIDSVTTANFVGASQLSFWVKGEGTDDSSTLAVEYYDGAIWSSIDTIQPLPTTGTIESYPLNSSAVQIRFTYTKSAGNLALDDVVISDSLLSHNIQNTTTGHYYATIQAAVDDASAGDHIAVAAGNYAENVAIGKSLTLIGTGNPTIDGVDLGVKHITLTNISSSAVVVRNTASIQDGIDAVADNGIVAVADGTYTENIVLAKTGVILAGETNKFPKILPADASTETVSLDRNNILFTGFDISNNGSMGIATGDFNGIKVQGNIITGNGIALSNEGDANSVDATLNYWGGSDPVFNGLNRVINASNVTLSPWFLDTMMTVMKFKTNLNVDGTISAGPSGYIGVYNDATMGRVIVEIQDGTTITGPSTWLGVVNGGIETNLSGVKILVPGKIISTVEGVEIGFPDTLLTLDKPALITFVGKGGESVGYRRNGVFTPITTVCDNATAPTNVIAGGECAISSPDLNDPTVSDLYVWTTHFTQFLTYTATNLPAPVFNVKAVTKGNDKYVDVNWTGVGADQYEIALNGVKYYVNAVASNDQGHAYTYEIKVASFGVYTVLVRSLLNGLPTTNTAKKSVEFAAPAPVPVAAPALSIAPAKAVAAAPADTNVQTPATPDKGVIKGAETTDQQESTNWTPWIVLFVLILLAGAATGGYFYWFAGKDGEERVEEKIVERSARKKTVAATEKTKPVKGDKTPKRW